MSVSLFVSFRPWDLRQRRLPVWALVLLLGAGCLTTNGPRPEQRGPTAPVIGLTGPVVPTEDGSPSAKYLVKSAYRDALLAAGALPVHLVPLPAEELAQLMGQLDGVLLTGGLDINPGAYGETPHPTVKMLPTERQEFDFAVAREALRRRLPLLGICLGAQELNVILGGSLVQDIPSEIEGPLVHRNLEPRALRQGSHPINVVPGTLLAGWYAASTVTVNSAHHQAVERLGQGLAVAARAPDGVVEAFVHEDYPFLVGVQFHPELQAVPAGLHAPLFRAFVEASQAFRRGR